MLSDECSDAELKELEKEWLLSDDRMLGLLSDDCREGLLSVLCRDARRPEEEKKITICEHKSTLDIHRDTDL